MANDTARLPLVNTSTSTNQYETKLLLTDANGCQDSTFYSPVIVFPDIRPTFTVSDTIGCSPLVINLTNTTVAGGGASFFWTMNGSPILSTTQTLTNPSFTDTLVFVISLRVSANGCEKTVSRNIYVKPTPKAGFVSSADPASFCSPVAVSFDGSSTLGADSLIWNFGGSSNDTTLVFNQVYTGIFSNNTAAAVQRRVTALAISDGGCKDSVFKDYTIQPRIQAAFTLSDTIACSPLVFTPTNLTNQAGNSNGAATSFNWLINGASYSLAQNLGQQTRMNPSATTTLTENWQLVASNGICTDTSDIQPTFILPNPVAQATAAQTQGCSPFTTQLLAAGTTGATTYKWYSRRKGIGASFVLFDTRSDTAAFNYTFINLTQIPVEYEVQLEASNSLGCQSSTFFTVTVFPKVTPSFTVSPDTIGCSPLAISLINTTSIVGNNNVFWTIDGTPVLSTSQLLVNNSHFTTKKFTVQLEVVAGICSGTATQDVYVKPVPLADFGSVAVPSDLCSPVAIQFNGGGSLGADTLLWRFGGNDTTFTTPANLISRTFANTTAAPFQRVVEMVAVSSGGCRDSLAKSYTIQPQIRAAFSISDTVGCSPLTTTIVNQSNEPVI